MSRTFDSSVRYSLQGSPRSRYPWRFGYHLPSHDVLRCRKSACCYAASSLIPDIGNSHSKYDRGSEVYAIGLIAGIPLGSGDKAGAPDLAICMG